MPTGPIRAAAERFLDTLSPAQGRKVSFKVDDRQWRIWNSFPVPADADGLSFMDMSEQQRQRALDLMQASLSMRGFQKAMNVMKLNETLAEMRSAREPGRYGQWKYWFVILGTPSDTEPWGWQFEGHHLVINYFVLGDQVVMTPTFMGAEPVTATSGKFQGTTVLSEEQGKALALFMALNTAQRATAAIRNEKGRNETLAGIYKDNLALDYAGIRATALDSSQRTQLLSLIAEYVNNEPSGHARIRMDDVEAHIDRTYFAWIGNTDPSAGPFYYRIQSPVILIEFDHQGSRDHIHTVVRTPNGNDYGADLLRQHYAVHPHTGQ
ncbi:MAG TPA: DUF3500 domain-containing protein [Vicinamibacterales bacterium]|nr:DUF3500 domain-containing protein [Vicinamibacterales bacterium]